MTFSILDSERREKAIAGITNMCLFFFKFNFLTQCYIMKNN